MNSNHSVVWPKQEIPVVECFDVVVAGAGMAGVAAAINAAQSGLKTCLIEYFGKPGGIPVSGGLGVISGFDSEKEHCVGGFALEIKEEMSEKGGFIPNIPRGAWDAEKLSSIVLRRLREAGVTVYFYTQVIGALKDGERATHVIISSKSGIEAFDAKVFIDDTGDGDLAVMLGCQYEKGRDSDGLSQSATLVVKLGGVNAAQAPRDLRVINQLWTSKPRKVPIDHTVVNYLPYAGPCTVAVLNMPHFINFDGTDKAELSRARAEGTQQAEELLEFFKNEVPGFENAHIIDTAMQIGVRETRRIVGNYILTEEDVISGRDFEDNIARCSAPIDIHNPDRPHGNFGSPGTEHRDVPRSYGIPYRCLTPKSITNLFVVGRSISATHRALASTRYNATCIALGQAAGCASPLVLKTGNTGNIDIPELQQILRSRGAIIDRTTK